MAVIRLGAWCDYVADADVDSLSFRVLEFAILADGRRVTLHDDRGFSTQPSAEVDPWELITLDQLESDVRNTVLPDTDDGDEHPWVWLAELLRAHAIATDPEQLKQVPYDVEFSRRVLARLATQRAGETPHG